MKGRRYKPVGWRGDSHRHYLAAKGVKTKRMKRTNPDAVIDLRASRLPNVEFVDDAPEEPIVIKFTDEPARFDKFVSAYRKRRGLDPENVVVTVRTDRSGPKKVIQVEDYVKEKAHAAGVRTKEEFALYRDDIVAGARARGAELKHAEEATVAKIGKTTQHYKDELKYEEDPRELVV